MNRTRVRPVDGTTLSRTTGFPSFERPGLVDEVACTYRGVGIGDSLLEVRSIFGPQPGQAGSRCLRPRRA